MNMKILKILFVSGVVSACFSLQAKTLQTFDKFIGEGHAIEVCQADLNKRALHEHCYGVNLSKTGTTTGKIEGFYNGNFDVTFTYLLGNGTLQEGPFEARATKPDGSAGEYQGKFLTIKRVLGVNTKLGAFYFNIPDTLGLKESLNALLNVSTDFDANNAGGYDYSIRSTILSAELAAKVYEIISSLVQADGNAITKAIIEAIAKDAEFSIGAVQLNIADDAAGTNLRKLAILEEYTLSTYVSNAMANDVYDVANTSMQRSYPVNMTLDAANKSFKIINFANAGYGISSSIKEFTEETTDTAGNVTVNTYKAPVTELSPLRGTYNLEDGTFEIENYQQIGINLSLYNSFTGLLGDLTIVPYNICAAKKYPLIGWVAVGSQRDRVVKGTIEGTPGQAYHSGANKWHPSVTGGELQTKRSDKLTFNFNPFTTVANKKGIGVVHTPFIDDTKITIDGEEEDVTHDVTIIDHSDIADQEHAHKGIAAVDDNNFYVYGAILPSQRSLENVDHYEVYVHHTKVDKISNPVLGLGGNYDAENGVKKANKVGELAAPAAGESTNFVIPVKTSDITNNNTKPLFGSQKAINPKQDAFAVYVKTVYKPESGLEPSFHALNNMTNTNVSVGVDGILTDKQEVEIQGGNGVITVSTGLAVEIFNMNGQKVYGGNGGVIAMPAGLYIVKSGNKVAKIMVR